MRRTRGNRPIRRVIENGDVPLPSDWNNFLASAENKEDLGQQCWKPSQHVIP